MKSIETVIEDEAEAYSSKHAEALLTSIQDLKLGEQAVNKLLTSEENEEAQRKQELYVKRMKKQLDLVKSNFPPSTAGCYTIDQAETFSWMITMQWLTTSHSAFMKKLNEKRIVLKAEAFPSIQLYAHYVYYLCFLGNRKPKELSEFGDLLHLFFFPYCKIIVLESNMYEIFSKIKSQCKILSNVEVRDIDFFKDLNLIKK